MRLVNVQTLQLEQFTGPIPADIPYAILSHTWEDDEVTFEDMKDLAIASTKKGMAKIEAACQMAINHGVQYIWVDTCCIDKSSSAELSEAINSMFRWYRDALVCFAFLSDLHTAQQPGELGGFENCRWFTRGWTLQELLAPADVLFFDQEWNLRGSKIDLMGEIQAITGIEAWVLSSSSSISTVPLAKRMFWAAKRQTTRIEDMAYSLLGIFDVNMPMIYGEGSKAFIRLQEEILKKTTDLSLFAWEAPVASNFRGILAQSPSEFHSCGSIVTTEDQFCFRDEIMMTNKGIKIITALQYSGMDVYILDLHCYREDSSGAGVRVGIYVKRAMDVYVRYEPQQTAQAATLPGRHPRPIFLTSATDADTIAAMVSDDKIRRINIKFPQTTPQYRIDDILAVPETYWHEDERYFSIHLLRRFRCFVRFCVTSRTPPTNPNYGTSNEESTQFILVCELAGSSNLRMSLYAETGLQSSPRPQGFIDPFRHIDQYGPLGDPFSLSVLSPGEQEDRSVKMIHTDQRHNYIVSASLDTTRTSPPFQVVIRVEPSDEYLTWQQRPRNAQHWDPYDDQVQELQRPQVGPMGPIVPPAPAPRPADAARARLMASSAPPPRIRPHDPYPGPRY